MPWFLWLGATGISATRKPKVSPAMFTGRSLLLQKLRRMVWMSGWGVVVLIARTSEVPAGKGRHGLLTAPPPRTAVARATLERTGRRDRRDRREWQSGRKPRGRRRLGAGASRQPLP